jgi:Icc-related predicted phosphoesterase
MVNHKVLVYSIGILDQCVGGVRAGCHELIKKVKEIKPLYHIFGHIHETYGTEKVGDTTFINASSCNYHYKAKNEPIVFELPKRSTTGNV